MGKKEKNELKGKRNKGRKKKRRRNKKKKIKHGEKSGIESKVVRKLC